MPCSNTSNHPCSASDDNHGSFLTFSKAVFVSLDALLILDTEYNNDFYIYFFIFTDVGINFALFAFVAVALGGFGSIIGCLYAGIIIGLVESLGGLLIDPSFKLLYVFAIYLLVVIYKPQGLFGRY